MGNVSSGSNTAIKQKYSTRYVINSVITLFFMFGFGHLPAFSTLTPVGMKVLGVFIGGIWGYSTCEVIWPSLFGIIAFGISGYTTMGEAITSMMGHNTVFQVLMGFLSAGALTYYGFGKWFVSWSLSKSIFKGRPLLYTWCFFICFGYAAFIITQIQLQILLYVVWVDIALICGYKKNSPFIYAGLTGILFSTSLGSCLVPHQSWKFGLAKNWGTLTGVPLNFGFMGVVDFILILVSVTLYVLSLKYVFKIDFEPMKQFDGSRLDMESQKMRPRAKRILAVYSLTVITVVLGNTFPSGTWLNTFVNTTMTGAGCFCACAAILLLLPSGENDGKPCIEFNAIKNSAISWQVIFMCAVTLPIATAVTSSDCGILEWITTLFAPVFAGKSSIFILLFTVVFGMLLTNVGSNIAFGSALIPIIAPFAVASGMNPHIVGAALIFTVNLGIVLPGASAPASIYHSNENIPDAKTRVKFTGFACLILLVVEVVTYSIINAVF